MPNSSVFSHNINTLEQLQTGATLSVDPNGYLVTGAPLATTHPRKSLFSRFIGAIQNPLHQAINQTCQQLFDEVITNNSLPLTSKSPALVKERVKVKHILDNVTKLGNNILPSQLESDLRELVQSPETLEARLALQQGIAPAPLNQTISGTYVMHNRLGQPWGIFKPMSQEVGGNKNPNWLVWAAFSAEMWDIESGTGYLRECIAYQLDKEHFSQVPLTVPTNFKHPALDTSIFPLTTPNLVGSFQIFKKNCTPLNASLKSYEYLIEKRNTWLATIITSIYVFALRCLFYFGLSHISKEQIHKIAILDMRILNCDRHLGNCLVEENTKILYPIDHGLVLPNKARKLRFEWKNLIQSRFPFSGRSLRYIEKLDPNEDANILKRSGIAADAIERMKLSTMLLKTGAARGLTAYQIADLIEQAFEEVICHKVFTKGENPQNVINQAIDEYMK